MRGGAAVAVGHAGLHLADVLVGQREVVGHDAAEVQHVGGDGVHVVGRQRLGLVPRHGAVHVVPHGRQARDLHQRGAAREGRVFQARDVAALDVLGRGAADDRAEHLVRFAEHAVARGALAFPQVLPARDGARAGRQALEVGTHVDVPRGHFLGRGVAADAGIACCLGLRPCGCTACENEQQQRALRKAGHSPPPRSPAPATTGWRCCDRSSACRAPRAAACSWAARSRCRPSRGSG
ncbi:hypothetical protein D9M68_433460 [compost metagenome]